MTDKTIALILAALAEILENQQREFKLIFVSGTPAKLREETTRLGAPGSRDPQR